jgi:sodium transport system ATP-binding protein
MIQVERLSRRFVLPGGGEIVAVDNLSFSVSAGEVYGLLGPNGAGKTTSLRMLLGLLQPSAGRATIEGLSSVEAPDEVIRPKQRAASYFFFFTTIRQWLGMTR